MRSLTSLWTALLVVLLAPAACHKAPECPACPDCPEVTEPATLSAEKGQPPAASAGVGLAPAPKEPAITVADALVFMGETEKEYLRLDHLNNQAQWVQNTYITDDSDALATATQEALMAYVSKQAVESVEFDKLELSPEMRRKIALLRRKLDLPAPSDPARRAELARIGTAMQSAYGKGKYCPDRSKGKCLTLDQMSEVLARTRKADEAMALWQGWHKVGPTLRDDFVRYVELANQGARDLGFANLGDLWKSRYDLAPAEFEAEVDRLWEQVKPLYQDLHCYTRARLSQVYGKATVPEDGPLPAHLLGNMWAQEWNNLYDLLAPEKDTALNVDKALADRQVDERGMVKYGEAFFTSLGLEPLPPTFWERSMFTRPRDREVVCHASAWDLDNLQDLRIKMCIHVTEEDFTTIHHELGHNYYQRAYQAQPAFFRDSAHDGFHEALGDLIALSVTPEYLVKVGLLTRIPEASALNPLMKRALEKVAFLPFGMLVDKWRWDVFAGVTPPEQYNKHWWDLRLKYQGVAPGVTRSEADFDPGAKYHVPANVPYTRYFLATILQFQFHRALCRQIGHQGPLHTCSIFQHKEAGARLDAMMKLGLSRTWTEAMKAMTGEEKMDASALMEFFAPLDEWLKKQNQGRQCGW
jgi:peptidyl-dipeptidase A